MRLLRIDRPFITAAAVSSQLVSIPRIIIFLICLVWLLGLGDTIFSSVTICVTFEQSNLFTLNEVRW